MQGSYEEEAFRTQERRVSELDEKATKHRSPGCAAKKVGGRAGRPPNDLLGACPLVDAVADVSDVDLDPDSTRCPRRKTLREPVEVVTGRRGPPGCVPHAGIEDDAAEHLGSTRDDPPVRGWPPRNPPVHVCQAGHAIAGRVD